MTCRKRKVIIALAVFVSAAPLVFLLNEHTAVARSRDGMRGGLFRDPQTRLLMGRFLLDRLEGLLALGEELNLTEAQKKEIRDSVVDMRGEFAPVIRDIMMKKKALRQAVLAEEPDEQSIRRAASAMGQAMGDTAVKLAGCVEDVREHLTPEQRETLREFQKEREEALDVLLQQVLGRLSAP